MRVASWLILLFSLISCIHGAKVLATEQNGITNLTVHPLGNGLLVYWDELSNSKKKAISRTVRFHYSKGKEQILFAKKGVYVEQLEKDVLEKVCVGDLYKTTIECIQKDQIRQLLEIRKNPVPIRLRATGSTIIADWTPERNSSSVSVKYYQGVWISGVSHHLTQITSSEQTQSTADSYDSCERYIFALYGIQPNNSWVEMGHLTLHSEDSKVMDLEALPYRDGTIIVFWNFVFRCSNSVAELRLWIDHETYEQKLDISQKFTVLKTPPIMDLGKHFTVGIILSQLDHGYVLANTSKTFLHERDPSVKWFESDAWEDRITVAWQKRSVPGERLLGVWREGKSYEYKLLSNGITEVTMESPDYCEDHELSLIGWYPSGKRVFLGQTQINTNWEKEQQTNLFPAKNGLLVHWKHFSLCEYTTYAVHVNGNGFTYSRKWAYKTDDNLFVSTLEDIEEVNVTYTALHSTDWSQQFSVHYHLKKINALKIHGFGNLKFPVSEISLKVKNIHYETDGMSIALEWPPMDPTELEFITFDQDMNVDIVRRHSTNTGPITMNFATCKPFELMMIQITGDNTKVLLGSVKIDAGEIRISGEKTSNEKVILSYVTKHCHPDHVYIHVGHPLNPHLPNGSVSSGFVELTELEPCVIYDVQLIAFYEPSYFSVSEMIRTALAPGLNESVPKVTIMNNNLVINWKPRAKCHLESASITVLKDSIIWKTLNVTNAIQETILQVPSVKAVYAVSIEFTYSGQFVERSDYAVVNYEPESYPQLKLEVQVQPRSVHLSWDSPKSYSPLYYRLDGLYNNGEEFITVILDQECVLPILRTMEYLNVIVSAVSVQGIRQVSGQITVWPTKVPQKPAPPVIEKKDHALYIYWKLNSTNPVDHLRIFVKSDRETWKREIQNPRPVGGFELKNTSCLTTACVITLQGVNRFGGSLISEPKSFHPISTIR